MWDYMTILTETKARNLKSGDKAVADGTVTGLRLLPSAVKEHGKWLLRYVSPVNGKSRDIGLGTYPEVSIVVARKLGLAAREQIANGIDPIDARKMNALYQRLRLRL
jgi:hypothetical protein